MIPAILESWLERMVLKVHKANHNSKIAEFDSCDFDNHCH